jgi:hypothetical protein
MRLYLSLAIAGVLGAGSVGQRGTTPLGAAAGPASANAQIVVMAEKLAAALDAGQRAKLQFALTDADQRKRWSNLPSPMFERRGVRLADLTPAQRETVMKLLTVALSADGYRKVTEIMQGDEVLKTGQSGGGRGGRSGGPSFGKDEYYISFVGTPSMTAPWMLQFGGHHLAINLTLGGGQASMTPSLPAAQPAKYTIEGREIRPLGKENDKAFALINALDASLRSQAILSYRVADLVLGPLQDGKTIQPEGLRASSMTPAQQTMLLDLVREWAGIVTDAFGEPRMAEIKANLPQTYFAWSGPITNGSAAYFRIQGPTLVIEYAPQQGSVDHIHTIYRDPTNDYGAKFAK